MMLTLTCWTALDALDVSPLPFLLVACKCDLRPEDSEVSVVHEQYEIYRTSPEFPRSQQMCIALVLRSVISNRGEF
jgi:GTPase SAR1 family protein